MISDLQVFEGMTLSIVEEPFLVLFLQIAIESSCTTDNIPQIFIQIVRATTDNIYILTFI